MYSQNQIWVKNRYWIIWRSEYEACKKREKSFIEFIPAGELSNIIYGKQFGAWNPEIVRLHENEIHKELTSNWIIEFTEHGDLPSYMTFMPFCCLTLFCNSVYSIEFYSNNKKLSIFILSTPFIQIEINSGQVIL